MLKVLNALAKEPITSGSGLSQPRKRTQVHYLTHPRKTIMHPRQTLTHPRKAIMHPRKTISHPQRSYDDMKGERANELVNLPMSPIEKLARVKIAVNIPENPGKKCPSCGLLNAVGTLKCRQCATLLPAPNEYVIATIKPAGGIGSYRLAQRIQAIQTRNLHDGYLKKREDVEDEITKRQTQCGQQGQQSPQQPALPPPSPRRKPIQKACSSCGAQNQPDAKFCNQCGSPI